MITISGIAAGRVNRPTIRMQIVADGYDPVIGFLHSYSADRPALVFDLMEPERPIVDRRVLELVQADTFHPADFTIRSDGVSQEVGDRLRGGRPDCSSGCRARQSRSNPAFHSSTMTAAMTSAVPMNAATISMIYLLRATVFSMIL
jgi:hypothetical protein